MEIARAHLSRDKERNTHGDDHYHLNWPNILTHCYKKLHQVFLAALGILHLAPLRLLDSSWGVLFHTCCGASDHLAQRAASIAGFGYSIARKSFAKGVLLALL